MKFKFILCLSLVVVVLMFGKIDIHAAGNISEATGDYYYSEDVLDAKMIEEIQEDIVLTAIDDYDGDISSSIDYLDKDDYEVKVIDLSPTERLLGTYKFEFFVYDSSHNRAALNLYVEVLDTVSPTITSNSVLYYEQDIDNITVTDESILAGVIGFDSYAQNDVSKRIISGSVGELRRTKDVQQYIKIEVADPSGNTCVREVIVVLKDYTKPVITTDFDTIETSYIANALLDTLLASANVSVNDNYDTNLTYTVSEDNYSSNKDHVGTFNVKLSATDTSNNVGVKTLAINVTDNIPPVFYLDISKVYVKTDVKLQKKDFLQLLKNAGKIKEPHYKFSVLKDDYSESADEEGQYDYFCRLSYQSGKKEDFNFKVNVLSGKTLKTKMGFFLGIKRIGLFIWNVFKWPILKIKKFL